MDYSVFLLEVKNLKITDEGVSKMVLERSLQANLPMFLASNLNPFRMKALEDRLKSSLRTATGSGRRASLTL